MIKIGLTGGIGTGKTTIAKRFEKLGVPVYYADDRAKAIMQHDAGIKRQIIDLFGLQAYHDKRLNTGYIGSKVFKNACLLKKLEAIVHPAVRQDFIKWCVQQNAPYVIVENAVLHKSGMDKLVDMVVLVTADMDKRLERLKKRDAKSIDDLQRIIKNQNKETELLKKSDFVIENNEIIELLDEKISKIDTYVKNMLKKG